MTARRPDGSTLAKSGTEAAALSQSESASARTNRSLVVGAATNWAAFALSMAVPFFLAPYLIRHLGQDRYGVWCVVESILAYFTLFDLGIAACLVRYVSKYHATDERTELNKIVSACLAVFAAAAACVLALGSALVPLVGPRLEAKLGGPGDVSAFMLLMLANLAATLPLSVFPTVLDGLQRFAAKSVVRLAFLAFRVAGIVYAMETRPGLFPLAVVYTAVNLLEHAAMGVLAFRFLPGLRVSRRLIDRETLRRVRGYSVDAFLAMLAGRITVQTGAVVVGGFLTAATAAHYAIAARLVESAKNLLRSATTTLTPAVSEREARGDHDGVRRVLLDGTRWVLYVVLPVHLGLLFFGRPFLERWIQQGPRYADWCFPATAILSATLTIGVAQSVAARILYGTGKLRLFARLALVEAALNLGLSLALVGPFGLEGVAVAVAGPNVLFCLFAIGYACRTLDVSAGRYLLTAWLRPLTAACIPAASWWFITPVEPTWLGIAVGIVSGLVPYGIAVFALEWPGFAPRVAPTRGGQPLAILHGQQEAVLYPLPLRERVASRVRGTAQYEGSGGFPSPGPLASSRPTLSRRGRG
jgi:O-antigen/teichoic acid export membrane protein